MPAFESFAIKQRLPILSEGTRMKRKASCDSEKNKEERIAQIRVHIGLY
jgi:hypothetical protein